MSKNKHKFLTFAALMTGATVAVHFINHTIATAAQLKQMLHISNDNYFEWRFGNIYYTKKGTGSPILLIHDTLPGASGYEWSKIEDELAIDHTVYTVDLLGCGRSDKSSITYTNFVYVQMISDFIKKIIGQKTDVIASGFSGSFVTMACHNEKELFNKIMLVNPPSLTQLKQMPNRKDRLLKAALEIPIFGTLVYHMIVSRDNINNLFIEKMYYNPFHVDNQMADAYYEAAHKGGYYTRFLYSSLAAKYINIKYLFMHLRHWITVFILLKVKQSQTERLSLMIIVPPTRLLKFLFSKKQNIFHMLKHLKRFLNRLKSSFKPYI